MEIVVRSAINLLFMALLYGFNVLVLFKLMSYAGMRNTWLAFIPLSYIYIFYKLFDGLIETRGKEWSKSKTRTVFYRIPYGILAVIIFFLLVGVSVNDIYTLTVFTNIGEVFFMIYNGFIAFHYSRIYLKTKSPLGIILAVIDSILFFIFILVTIDRYRKSVDEFYQLSEDNVSNSSENTDVLVGTNIDIVSTVDNETLEELFTDVKVVNDSDSGIHLTNVANEDLKNTKELDIVSEELSVDKRVTEVEIAQLLFEAEVAALEAERELDNCLHESMEAEIKAMEAELEVAKFDRLLEDDGYVTLEIDKDNVYGSFDADSKSFKAEDLIEDGAKLEDGGSGDESESKEG